MMALDRQMFSDKLQRYMTQLQVAAEDVEKDTGIPRDRLGSILDRTSDPTGDEVLILADYFRCDYKFFVSNEKLAPFEQTESLFRKHDSELSREDRWAIQEFLFLCECQAHLLSQLPSPMARGSFSFTKSGTYQKGHGENAAESLRRHLGYGDHEVPKNVYNAFRDIGIHVFRRLLSRSTISGLFIAHPTAGLCVLVNYSEDIFRQRFTACHEAGHAILDDGQDFVVSYAKWNKRDLSEVRANTFASRFLLPPALLNSLGDPQSWDESQFLQHAIRLMVNAATLAYALREAGRIDDARTEAFKKLKVPAAHKTDPEIPADLAPKSRERKQELLQRGLSDSYVALCFDGYHQGIVSASRLAEMLLISEMELGALAALYGRPLSHGD